LILTNKWWTIITLISDDSSNIDHLCLSMYVSRICMNHTLRKSSVKLPTTHVLNMNIQHHFIHNLLAIKCRQVTQAIKKIKYVYWLLQSYGNSAV